jgi:hypothetical protein
MKRRNRWIVGGVAAVVVLAAVAIWLWGGVLEEVGELAAEGGEIQLREPMRPVRGEERALIFALDGVGAEAFREIVHSGRAPATAGLLGREVEPGVHASGYIAAEALSILPSTTMAAWASVFTGEPVARTGVSGNEWFDRATRRFYAPGPASVQDHEHALKMFTESLVSDAIMVPTLFEQMDLRTHVSLQMVHRGADLLSVPALSDVASLFGAVASGVTGHDPEREAYVAIDTQSADRVVETLERHGIPDVQVVYFGGIDLYTHQAEEALDRKQAYYEEILDPAIARIVEVYRTAGVLDDTYILFISDHGHTPVLAEERNALGVDRDGDPPEVLERTGFRVRPFEIDVEAEDFQAVLAYQGAIAYVYLADRSTCPGAGDGCSWMLPPRLEEDVLPVVRAFDRSNRFGDPSPKLRGAIDLVFAREPRPVGEDALAFQVWNGERLVPVGEYLAANPRPDLLDLETRMDALSAGPYGHRAGDVLLLARSGMHRPLEERFYFSHLYRSWHGSATPRDSRITFAVAHTRSSGAELRQRVEAVAGGAPSQLDFTPLVRELLRR